VYPLRRTLREGRVWLEKLLFGAPALVAAVVAAWAVGPRQFDSVRVFSGLDRLAMAAHSFTFYLWKTLVPASLSPIYEVPLRLNLLEPRFTVSAVVVVVLTVLVIAARRRAPWAAAAWAYHVLTILPVSGLTHAGLQLAYDRYTYLPGLAWALLGGGAVAALLHRWRQAQIRAPLAAVLCLAVLVTLAGWVQLTWRQIGAWHDSDALWRRAVLIDPVSCAVCRHGLGVAERDAGHYPTAEQEFRTALAIRPTYTQAHLSLADLLQRTGRHDEALNVLADVERAHPDDPALLAELAQVRAAALKRAGRS
jgi:tetratricopeptide (TPR) repeat protein